MNINITLIIQGCNFFIAYMLIRFLLFKPVFAFIKKEWDERDGLNAQITEGKKSVEEKAIISDKQWGQCRNYFSKYAPKLEYLPPELKDVALAAERDLSKDKLCDFENEIARILVEKVDHVG